MEFIRFTGFDIVQDNLIKLQEEYLKYNQLIKHNFGFFVFPDTLFKDILNDVGKIKKILIDKTYLQYMLLSLGNIALRYLSAYQDKILHHYG